MATGAAYALVASEMWLKGSYPLAVMWTGYAISQAGLYVMTKSAS